MLYCHYLFRDQVHNFSKQMILLRNLGDFVTTEKAVSIIVSTTPLERHAFHLSFDDGLACVVNYAAPVLADLGIPFSIFVPTSIISSIGKGFDNHRRIGPSSPRMVQHATWDDLARAQSFGAEIGSHTASHARLSEISHDRVRLEEEISASKREIEERLGSGCNYISWPYGKDSDIDQAAIRSIQEAGYAACFGAFRGRVIPGKTDLYRIPRHHFEPDWPVSHLRAFATGFGESARP